ncbi:MAG: hypothetical protein F6K42_23655 [Leptolyngbya sp. SIO1D8]|nr:hypothetical protein [Leptolyngbya sp. SIO1D8]
MRYPSTVQVSDIERSTVREGFSEPYHKVTFDLISEGIPTSQLVVWVHPAFPDDDLIRVARTFAWSRLAALLAAASEGVFSEDEIQVLWECVRPDDFVAS